MAETSGVIIEAASLRDIDAIHRIEAASFPAPWRKEFFLAELVSEGRLTLVARTGGRVVGYLFAMWILDEMHVNKIAVDEAHRRAGIAGLLMARCFSFAETHAVQTISLEVRQSNDAAQEFYRHLAFEPLYIRQRYYPDGEAAVVMTCRLRP